MRCIFHATDETPLPDKKDTHTSSHRWIPRGCVHLQNTEYHQVSNSDSLEVHAALPQS